MDGWFKVSSKRLCPLKKTRFLLMTIAPQQDDPNGLQKHYDMRHYTEEFHYCVDCKKIEAAE